jgi:hypothetical protein
MDKQIKSQDRRLADKIPIPRVGSLKTRHKLAGKIFISLIGSWQKRRLFPGQQPADKSPIPRTGSWQALFRIARAE